MSRVDRCLLAFYGCGFLVLTGSKSPPKDLLHWQWNICRDVQLDSSTFQYTHWRKKRCKILVIRHARTHARTHAQTCARACAHTRLLTRMFRDVVNPTSLVNWWWSVSSWHDICGWLRINYCIKWPNRDFRIHNVDHRPYIVLTGSVRTKAKLWWLIVLCTSSWANWFSWRESFW